MQVAMRARLSTAPETANFLTTTAFGVVASTTLSSLIWFCGATWKADWRVLNSWRALLTTSATISALRWALVLCEVMYRNGWSVPSATAALSTLVTLNVSIPSVKPNCCLTTGAFNACTSVKLVVFRPPSPARRGLLALELANFFCCTRTATPVELYCAGMRLNTAPATTKDNSSPDTVIYHLSRTARRITDSFMIAFPVDRVHCQCGACAAPGERRRKVAGPVSGA